MHDIALGVRRFRDQRYPGKKRLFRELAGGQSPPVLFITCSDSRLDPHLFTSAEPGDLFVIRNAGNLIPPYRAVGGGGEQGTLEYAVSVLGVRDVVVCGHSDCGAMKGLLAPESLSSVPSVASWLDVAKPSLERCKAYVNDIDVMGLVEANTLEQVENLRTHPCVSRGQVEGTLSLHVWVFDIEMGLVTTYDARSQCFVELADRLVPIEAGEAAARA